MKILKQLVQKAFNSAGYNINKYNGGNEKIIINHAVELSTDEVKLICYILDNGYSMTSIPRLINTLKSCKYVIENKIPGDFVECGVWRGGNGILAKKIFEAMGSDKKVWMFDTFEGMTEPTNYDVRAASKTSASVKYQETLAENHSEWCYASIEEVRDNCKSSLIDISSVKFIKGDVIKTLAVNENLPKEISVLRLDTDWYESTKVELEVLYPILSEKGVLIVDDYGCWEGARKAIDEYFRNQQHKPLLNVVDSTGRTALKV
jgi:O-methyltransferase